MKRAQSFREGVRMYVCVAVQRSRGCLMKTKELTGRLLFSFRPSAAAAVASIKVVVLSNHTKSMYAAEKVICCFCRLLVIVNKCCVYGIIV